MRKKRLDSAFVDTPVSRRCLKRRFRLGGGVARRCHGSLRRSGDRLYRTIVENTGTAFLLMAADTTIVMVNDEFEHLSGYGRHEVEGRMSWTRLIAAVDRARMLGYHHQRRLAPDRAPRNYECRVRVKDGRLRTCFFTVAMIPGSDRSIASITDVTDHRRMERRIHIIRENERRRIGQDLHDDLGAHLVGVEAMAELLQRRLTSDGHAQAPFAAEIAALVTQAAAKTRALGRGLCPVEMDDRGLLTALENLGRHVRRAFGVDCALRLNDDTGIRNHEAATHLYRIVQEAVNNAVVHGRARSIVIDMAAAEDVFTLAVTDDGIGIRADAEQGPGMGLRTMRHRANRIGAVVSVTRQQPRGTRVQCSINSAFLS